MEYREHKNLNFANVNSEILKFWKENRIFEKSVENRQGKPLFTFYEGPPSANGMPGIHHVMSRTLKDIFCRYKTLDGYQVHRKGGWDTHGLPIELQVEKELGITKEDIGNKISVEEYNQKCRETVMRYKEKWDDITEKTGYWVDLNNPYITFESNFIESLWYLLKKMHEHNFLYKGFTIQPFSPAAGTGLSSHELNMPGTYKPVKDTTAVVQFKVKNQTNLYILAWTTTPWTLPSNSALAVGKDIDYVKVETHNQYTNQAITVILAKAAISRMFTPDKFVPSAEFDAEKTKNKIPFTIVDEFKGSHILGWEYEQLLPYIQPLYDGEKAFKVIAGDFVSTEDGTGVVHIAPTFGADDFRVARQNGVPPITIRDEHGKEMPLVNRQGKFVANMEEFSGMYVKAEYENAEISGKADYKSADVLLAIKLKEENKAFKVEKYEHNYPHCWRTDKPILYYPMDSWFIRTTAIKDKLVQNNKKINWKPASTGEGRFGNWLENLVDWNLSRSRFWGTPLPIWVLKEENEEKNAWKYLNTKSASKKAIFTKSCSSIVLDNEKEIFGNQANSYEYDKGWFFFGEKFKTMVDNIKTSQFWKQLLEEKGEPFADKVNSVLQNNEKGNPLLDDVFEQIAPKMYIEYLDKHNESDDENLEEVFYLETLNPHRRPTIYEFGGYTVLCLDGKRDFQSNNDYNNDKGWYYLGEKFEKFVKGLSNGDNEVFHSVLKKHLANDDKKVAEAIISLCDYQKSFPFVSDLLKDIPYDSYKEYFDKIGEDETVLRNLDLHRPFVDRVFRMEKLNNGKVHFWLREPDLVDVWFDSGAMPYAQWHFPFENEDKFNTSYPADFIAEGVDQTRGWFFTLHAIAGLMQEIFPNDARFQGIAFKNVISNGLLLDKNGNKMSKRLGNVVNPFEMVETYGSDPVRWYMMENCPPWENLKFSVEGVQETQRKFFGTLQNTYSFFALYANLDKFVFDTNSATPIENRTESDRWVLSRLHSLVREVKAAYDDYEPTKVARAIQEFVVDDLSNWYVRLNRKRFWLGEMSADKKAAYETLYECLEKVSLLMSPIAPFYADQLYRDLKGAKENESISVHLAEFPVSNEKMIDFELEQRMVLAQKACSLIHSLRKKERIRVRLPLQKVMMPVLDNEMKNRLELVKDIILSEVNVKNLEFMTEDSEVLVKKIKPNFKRLGKTLGALMKDFSAAVEKMTQADIKNLDKTGEISLTFGSETRSFVAEDFEITSQDIPGWLVANDGAVTVALDITITPELEREGLARDFVNRIQNLRKDKGLEVQDKINIRLQTDSTSFEEAVNEHKIYICAETQALSMNIVRETLANATEVDMEDFKIAVEI